MKSSTSFILTASNSPRGSKLFEYLKLGWETVNNRMHSCWSPGKLVRQVESHLRGLDLNTPIMPRNFINWSCKLTPFQRQRDGGGGCPSKVRGESIRQ